MLDQITHHTRKIKIKISCVVLERTVLKPVEFLIFKYIAFDILLSEKKKIAVLLYSMYRVYLIIEYEQ